MSTPISNTKALALLYRGAQTKRFHTLPFLQPETVGEHSAMVAGLIALFDPDCRAVVLKAALFHDHPEFLTGDTPAPTKNWKPEVREALNEIEDRVFERALGQRNFMSNAMLTTEENRLLKFADRLAGLLACMKEVSLGNQNAVFPALNFANYLASMDLSEYERRFAREAVTATTPFPMQPSSDVVHFIGCVLRELEYPYQMASVSASERWDTYSFSKG